MYNSLTGPYSSPQTYPESITTNRQPIRLSVPNFVIAGATYQPNKCKVKIILIDKVGCISLPFEIGPINLPEQPLNITWSSEVVSGGCDKTFTVVNGSGIGPYRTILGPELQFPNTPPPVTATSTVPCNNIISATVEDNVGCSITKASNSTLP
jgi:hypothetical protein